MTATPSALTYRDHTAARIRTLAQVTSYAEAERLVDRLSDAGFSVDRVRIVGIDVYSVEQATGRMTNSRAAATGAATGALLGLATGLLLGLFTTGIGWLTLLFGATVAGSTWGAAFGFVAYRATARSRDSASAHDLRAMRYAIQVEAAHADDARRLLGLH
jgi:anion-transporting  ArsA/GET3 family ATPase